MKLLQFKFIFPLIIIAIALIFLFLFPSCKREETKLQKVYNEGFIQGTTYHITYLSSDGEDYHSEIKATLAAFNKSMSVYDSTSIISRINRNDSTVRTDSIFNTVFLKAQEVSEKTDGAFDMTVGPLCKMWGFNNGKRISVTPAMVKSLLPYIGYQKVHLNGNKLIKDDPRILLDANAIAQGYSSDLIGKLLEKKGITNYMVEIGGEVMTKGVSPRGDAWKIGINQPIDDSTSTVNEVEDIVRLENIAISTSGNYRKFYIHNGKKYGHEIDPHTGYPVTHSLLSATIIAPDCMTADAYATACMVIGVEKSQALLKKLPGIEGYFIYKSDDGKNVIVYTKGFEKYLKK